LDPPNTQCDESRLQILLEAKGFGQKTFRLPSPEGLGVGKKRKKGTKSRRMNNLYKYSILLIFTFAVIVFVLLFSISAPYGKFSRKGWGPAIKSKWAWMIMEFPSPALMFMFFITSDKKSLLQAIFLILWLGHYLHRTFVYPFRQSGKEKAYPLLLVMMAFIFNCFNGFANGYGIFHLFSYDISYLLTWQFIGGILLFITGFIINKISDEKLRNFRKQKPSEYVVPDGWLFDYISSPHYFGEIIEWAGWAVITWSLPGLAFFIFTFANLFPRAISSHRWYKKNFPDYPPERKAIIPFIL
jgi:steroid 5-alpha reductase family enzyme